MGAALVGDRDFIGEAERLRTMLGGTMRQIGFMAAAALYGLENNLERLVEDHANARLLAVGLAAIDGLTVDLAAVQSNMVYVDVDAGPEFAQRIIEQLAARDIRAWSLGSRLRFVTSMLVGRADCERVLEAMSVILNEF